MPADEHVGFLRKAADKLMTIALLLIPHPIRFRAYIFVDRDKTGAWSGNGGGKTKMRRGNAITIQYKVSRSRERREFGNKQPLRSVYMFRWKFSYLEFDSSALPFASLLVLQGG
jgi:hypothetical protein